MKFRTISDLNKLIYDNLEKIPKDTDLVVGIPRSGMLVANLIALSLNLPLTDIDSLLNDRILACGNTRKNKWISSIGDARRILLVDDSSDTGRAYEEVKRKLETFQYRDKVTTLIAYVNSNSKRLPDIYLEVCNGTRMFEWNFLHHTNLINACFDIDGVLCRDPSEEENDDGEKYIEFIRNVPAKYTPSFKIGYLVTSRLEKYRNETELWLKDNNIQYGKLIMMQFKTKEERVLSGSHGKFKGEHYKKIRNADFFVESDAGQACEIANISHKAVFCIENRVFYEEGKKAEIRDKVNRRVIKIYCFLCNIVPKPLKDIIKKIIS